MPKMGIHQQNDDERENNVINKVHSHYYKNDAYKTEGVIELYNLGNTCYIIIPYYNA